MKKPLILLVGFLLVLCFSTKTILAQKQAEFVEKIVFTIKQKSERDIILEILINRKAPISFGESYRIETSNIDSIIQISSSAIYKKPGEVSVNFAVVNQEIPKRLFKFNKRFKLKIGEIKTFKFRTKLAFQNQQEHHVTAHYFNS